MPTSLFGSAKQLTAAPWLRSPQSVIATVAIFVATGASAADPDRTGVEFFETHIRPVLVTHCYECHSADADASMGGLRLDNAAAIREGGDHGAAFVAGDPAASLIVKALRQEEFEMPPDGRLPEETIRRFEQWVRMGAPDPRNEDPVRSEQGSEEGEHWAFVPPAEPNMPEVAQDGWPTGDIDRFVRAKMAAADLQPVEQADRPTLIRRAYFDLWGLPPHPTAVDAFLEDDSSTAYADLVDRLLQSPRFGERWGRHWLDVARFAESTGRERNFLYPHAWRYRDYVVQSLNEDKPYDQFIIEQIAGDKLPAETAQQRDEQRIATGLLALGERNLLDGNDESYGLDMADDQINVTTRAILGLTVACARCHDHKFDPIPTAEYYGLAGIFLSTETLYGTVPGTGGGNNKQPRDLVPIGPDAEAQHAVYAEWEAKLAKATKESGKIQNRRKKLRSLPEDQQAKKQEELAEAEQEYRRQQEQVDQLKSQAPTPPAYAMGVRDAQEIVEAKIRIGGVPRERGEEVPRSTLSCITQGDAPQFSEDTSGRLALAHWLASPDNPLTARVVVNRVWHHLFGRGLVSTVDNFGRNGAAPSHPELLDWLAIRFVEDGWSIKRMIRQIMLSQTYQLAASYQARNYSLDPENFYLWRRAPRRLEAEAIRDAMLVASGDLELCRPPQGSVVAGLGDGCLVRQIDPAKLATDDPVRSVYLPTVRFFTSDLYQAFDGASPSLVVGARGSTNVPTQALFLLNNDFVIERASKTAALILERSDLQQRDRVALAYRRLLSRPPTSRELDLAAEYLRRSFAAAKDAEKAEARQTVWAGLCQAIFASAEFRYVY